MVDVVDQIIAYENGELDHEGTVALFQQLVDDGTINHLQGHYGRVAMASLRAGEIKRPD